MGVSLNKDKLMGHSIYTCVVFPRICPVVLIFCCPDGIHMVFLHCHL
uniref:Uncharacterized protein n=1 Tax=Rhizophora mucronata TaxID=61149 RepID=A0A2P2Q5Y1_RHIMU